MSKHAIQFDHSLDMAKQSFADECNINKIMAKFQRTGAIDHVHKYGPSYGDVTSATLHEAMNIIADAESMFEELPASLRKKFGNDPEQFLDYVQDPNNLEEMRELGLAKTAQTTINDDISSNSRPKTNKKTTTPTSDSEVENSTDAS